MSLVVGSIAHAKTTERDAEENDRSPFSRIGPGVENHTKPDLVHYGGNWDTHISAFSIYGRQFCMCSGTSFSTPRIASLAANIQYRLGVPFNPLLIRAILIHNAFYPHSSILHRQPYSSEKESPATGHLYPYPLYDRISSCFRQNRSIICCPRWQGDQNPSRI